MKDQIQLIIEGNIINSVSAGVAAHKATEQIIQSILSLDIMQQEEYVGKNNDVFGASTKELMQNKAIKIRNAFRDKLKEEIGK